MAPPQSIAAAAALAATAAAVVLSSNLEPFSRQLIATHARRTPSSPPSPTYYLSRRPALRAKMRPPGRAGSRAGGRAGGRRGEGRLRAPRQGARPAGGSGTADLPRVQALGTSSFIRLLLLVC